MMHMNYSLRACEYEDSSAGEFEPSHWLSQLSSSVGSMADFQTIAAGIFEEYRIVARSLVITGSFHILGTGPDRDLCQPLYLAVAVCPEGDPALVGDMLRRLSDTEKFRSTVRPSRFILQPTFDADVACEAQGRQEPLIEGAYLSQTTNP